MRHQTAFLLSALLALWLALPARAAPPATPVFPPGLRVGLAPAADLKPARDFPGFADSDRNVAVTVLELPGAAYDQIARSTFAMPAQGVSRVGREVFPYAGGLGFLVHGRTVKDGTERQLWVLVVRPVAGDAQDLTALIRVEVPAAAGAVYSDAVVRRMLASATIRPEPVEERLGLLPFRLTDLAGFRVSRVSSNGVVILTEGASDDLAEQAYAVISIGRNAPNNPDDYPRFARNLLAGAPIRGLAVTSADPMRLNGTPGFEIRARGESPTGAPLSLVQWLRFAGDGFIRLVAITPQQEWDRMFTRFRALRDGIALR
jgi:hypothetical protein